MFKRFCLIVVLIIGLVSPALSFDKVHGVVPEFDAEESNVVVLDGTVVQVLTRGYGAGITPDHKWANGSFEVCGVGTVIAHNGNIYVITAAHVVHPSKVVLKVSQYVFVITPIIHIHNVNISVGSWNGLANVSASLFYINHIRDVAILKIDNHKRWAYKEPAKWELAELYDIVYLGFGRVAVVGLVEAGDAIAVPVRARNEDGSVDWRFELRKGFIVKPGPHVDPGMEEYLPFLSMWHMTAKVEVYPGDSGSPVLAFKNGKPVIIGIIVAKMVQSKEATDYYTYFAPIDHIKWIIEAKEED